jgi:hypothetical protein
MIKLIKISSKEHAGESCGVWPTARVHQVSLCEVLTVFVLDDLAGWDSF